MVATAAESVREKKAKKASVSPLYKTVQAVQALMGLTVTWSDSLFVPTIIIWTASTGHRLIPILGTMALTASWRHYGQEFAKNVNETYRAILIYMWRVDGTKEWTKPRLEGLELVGFIGIWATIRLWKTTKLRGVPYEEMRCVARRRNGLGDPTSKEDKWALKTGDYLKRRFRYNGVNPPEKDPSDSNLDIIVLSHNLLPDLVEAV